MSDKKIKLVAFEILDECIDRVEYFEEYSSVYDENSQYKINDLHLAMSDVYSEVQTTLKNYYLKVSNDIDPDFKLSESIKAHCEGETTLAITLFRQSGKSISELIQGFINAEINHLEDPETLVNILKEYDL